MTGTQERKYIERVIARCEAAILSVNDTMTNFEDRDRMRRTVLDQLELLRRRLVDEAAGIHEPYTKNTG
jgi:hypothetical protein